MSVVLDASALLCYLQQEPGASQVSASIEHSMLSAVNWSEVAQKTASAGVDSVTTLNLLQDMGLKIVEFTVEDACICAGLWSQTRPHGLSLADRACLALAMQGGWPVMTCDRAWTGIVYPA
ncbi:MAG: type II toxin-antitoxin system VapC family toxin [Gammaproteobacteria bacterium]|nr:type II toxin-antitoxin system VapC family toxin [Gammaproteobacteria bacterium]